MVREDWKHRACLPQIQDCARQALAAWAECEYPLRISPRMLMQFGVVFSSLSSLCMRLRGWDFSPPPFCADLAKDFIAAFHLNWADDEKRMQRELINLGATDTETVIGKRGVELEPPSLMLKFLPLPKTERNQKTPPSQKLKEAENFTSSLSQPSNKYSQKIKVKDKHWGIKRELKQVPTHIKNVFSSFHFSPFYWEGSSEGFVVVCALPYSSPR